jgi:cytosine/uracil/thiamine/allantoin permease
MNQTIGIALLILGIVLLIFGFNESHSFSSSVSRAFTNSPSDRSMWFLIGGAVAMGVGLFATLNRSR